MLDQILRLFDIEPDVDLDIMTQNQALPTLTARLLLDLDDALQADAPDVILAQGDTTTVMTIALTCFYHRIPFGHVEAGLRTGDLEHPFPEENEPGIGRAAGALAFYAYGEHPSEPAAGRSFGTLCDPLDYSAPIQVVEFSCPGSRRGRVTPGWFETVIPQVR